MSSHPLEPKLIRIFSERRDREVTYRVEYAVKEQSGCKCIELRRIEDLG